MALILDRIVKGYDYLFEDLADPRVKSHFLMSSPFPGICLILFYFYFVLKLGPQLMANRKPFKLEKIIMVYNLTQIFACLYLVIMALRYTVFSYNMFCEPIDYSYDEVPVRIARHVHLYFLLKVYDLLDSVFFVLRKKEQHLTFLHIYHHAGMCVVVWCGTKFLPGGHGVIIGFINCIVHMIMYFYYFLSIWNENYKKNIWWKKHLTQLQMGQFMFLAVHFTQLLFQPNCAYPKWTVWIFVPQNIFMIILFTHFYINTYVNTPEKQKIQSNNCSNGHKDLMSHKIKTQ